MLPRLHQASKVQILGQKDTAELPLTDLSGLSCCLIHQKHNIKWQSFGCQYYNIFLHKGGKIRLLDNIRVENLKKWILCVRQKNKVDCSTFRLVFVKLIW